MKPRRVRAAAFLASWLALALPATARQETPAPPSASDFERALASHPYFGKLQFERVEGHAPLLFLFARASEASPQHAASFAEKMAPYLAGTLQVFEQHIARPNALARRAGHERFPVIVLASKAEFEKCQRTARAPWHMGGEALHDRALNACVLYEAPKGEERQWHERVRSARHVFLHACQSAWYAGADKPPLENWILEGLADALANTTADPATIRPDPRFLDHVVGATQDARESFTYLRTLAELFSIGEPARLDSFYRAHTPRELAPLKSVDKGGSFYCQAALFFGFLWAHENARHRPALVAFLGDVLRGAGGAKEFQERFQPASAAELEQGFLAWTLREHEHARPLEKVDAERAMRALARGEAAGFSAPLPKLELSETSPEERLALAIHQMAVGAEDEAKATLDALAGAELEASLGERVERERRRLACWRGLRDAHLAALAARKGTLSFTSEGKRFQAKVRALEARALVLEKNGSGKERLALDELDPYELAQDMQDQGTPDDWARMVPYALRGDKRTKKLADDDGDAGALRRDALEDYPARLRLGRMLARILHLGQAPPPKERGQAESLLTELRALRSEGGSLELVQRMEPALLEKARTWLEAAVATMTKDELFGAELEELPDGRVRLTYTFDEPRELEDFEACRYPAEIPPPMEILDQPFHLQDGRLVALGQAGLRTLYELWPPLSVHYGLAFQAPTPGLPEIPKFFLGIADDGREHFVASYNFWELEVRGAKKSEQARGKTKFKILQGTVYELELAHDGQQAFLRCEGQEIALAAAEHKNGAIFLRAHSTNPVHLTELVIEGKLLPGSLAELRRARVERELASF